MRLEPIKLPPGVYKNGTPYSSKGRWSDTNLVRWHDNALRPIGGWIRRRDNLDVLVPSLVVNPTTETVRDMITFRSNTGARGTVFGSNLNLYYMTQSNALSTVTPVGFVTGGNQPSFSFGYGLGPYGRGLYGRPVNAVGANPDPVYRWNFDMWGENVLGAGINSGVIYEYVPGGLQATILANAPTDVADIIVTEERNGMVIKNGVGGLRQVIWSDRENNTEWTPTQSNYAGSRVLQGSGNLLTLHKLLNQIIILSENDLIIGRYLGAPFVYGFENAGEQCGPITSKAVATTDRFAIWLGERKFWMYDGTLKTVPCDVIDFLQEDIDTSQVSKMHTLTVSDFSEIWWFYQSVSSTTSEVDSYVFYDYLTKHWGVGKLDRTCGLDKGIFQDPVMVDTDGLIWNHEQRNIQLSSTPFAITGPLEMKNGAENLAIKRLFPDTKTFGSVEFEFFAKQMPSETEYMYGPFSYANPVPTTGVLGREIRLKVSGIIPDWEFGTPRVEVQKIGGGNR